LINKENKLRTIEVNENDIARLDKMIAEKCEDLSRTMIQKLIQDTKIFVNGKPRKSIIESKKRRYNRN
jgi:RNA-binding protein YlmH